MAPEANLGDGGPAHRGRPRSAPKSRPAWQQALQAARLPLYDVHWPTAVVVEEAGQGEAIEGRACGRPGRAARRRDRGRRVSASSTLYDVCFVRVSRRQGQSGARAELRVRPTVQGAALVLENKTGRILAMAGGFSYPLSQLNRTTQTQRQPGSSFKPFTYLAALRKGLQPNTLVRDEPITLPPIGSRLRAASATIGRRRTTTAARRGILTLRRALENSKNLVTAHLLDGGID